MVSLLRPIAGKAIWQDDMGLTRSRRHADAARDFNVIISTRRVRMYMAAHPQLGGAIANAVFAATGKRIRALPLMKAPLGA